MNILIPSHQVMSAPLCTDTQVSRNPRSAHPSQQSWPAHAPTYSESYINSRSNSTSEQHSPIGKALNGANCSKSIDSRPADLIDEHQCRSGEPIFTERDDEIMLQSVERWQREGKALFAPASWQQLSEKVYPQQLAAFPLLIT